MKRWLVVSPEYETYSYDKLAPPEYGCDVIEIEAATKRDALMLGVAAMLKDRAYRYCRENRLDGRSPWAGMRAEPVSYAAFIQEAPTP